MALATYTDLQTSIGSWLARTDLTSIIPDLITLCETDFMSTLRVRQMEGRADSPTGGGSTASAVALPPDFLEMRTVRVLSPAPGNTLDLVSPDYITSHWATTDSGPPRVFTIVGPEIILGPAPDAVYTLELDYYAFTPLSVAAPTNWLLTSFPGVYLYGSLLKAMPYTRNDARAATWQGMFDDAIGKLMAADLRARWPMGKLVSRPYGSTP